LGVGLGLDGGSVNQGKGRKRISFFGTLDELKEQLPSLNIAEFPQWLLESVGRRRVLPGISNSTGTLLSMILVV
jgi:hypothetical protein